MPNMFGQNGPLARTVGDAALILQVLAGHDPRDPISLRETPPISPRPPGATSKDCVSQGVLTSVLPAFTRMCWK